MVGSLSVGPFGPYDEIVIGSEVIACAVHALWRDHRKPGYDVETRPAGCRASAIPSPRRAVDRGDRDGRDGDLILHGCELGAISTSGARMVFLGPSAPLVRVIEGAVLTGDNQRAAHAPPWKKMVGRA